MVQLPAFDIAAFDQDSLVQSQYQALLAMRSQTPWGTDWAGKQTYTRAPGLSLAELDHAWRIERWRFATHDSGTSCWKLPNSKPPKLWDGIMYGLLVLSITLSLGSDNDILRLISGVAIIFMVLVRSINLRPYWAYVRARRAYAKRRAKLVRQNARA